MCVSDRIRIMGIDPGIAHCGYGFIDFDGGAGAYELVDCGLVYTAGGQPDGVRLRSIYNCLDELIYKHRPALVFAERAAVGKSYGFGDSVSLCSAIVKLVCADHDLIVQDFAPTRIKAVVAKDGKADKHAVAAAVCEMLGDSQWLNPIKRGDQEHVADALAVALAGTITETMKRTVGPKNRRGTKKMVFAG